MHFHKIEDEWRKRFLSDILYRFLLLIDNLDSVKKKTRCGKSICRSSFIALKGLGPTSSDCGIEVFFQKPVCDLQCSSTLVKCPSSQNNYPSLLDMLSERGTRRLNFFCGNEFKNVIGATVSSLKHERHITAFTSVYKNEFLPHSNRTNSYQLHILGFCQLQS